MGKCGCVQGGFAAGNFKLTAHPRLFRRKRRRWYVGFPPLRGENDGEKINRHSRPRLREGMLRRESTLRKAQTPSAAKPPRIKWRKAPSAFAALRQLIPACAGMTNLDGDFISPSFSRLRESTLLPFCYLRESANGDLSPKMANPCGGKAVGS